MRTSFVQDVTKNLKGAQVAKHRWGWLWRINVGETTTANVAECEEFHNDDNLVRMKRLNGSHEGKRSFHSSVALLSQANSTNDWKVSLERRQEGGGYEIARAKS